MIFQFKTQDNTPKLITTPQQRSTDCLITEYYTCHYLANCGKYPKERVQGWVNYADKIVLEELRSRIPLLIELWETETNFDWTKFKDFLKNRRIKAV